jgi:hypothetical protein
MPWELEALPSDGSGSLGSIEQVQARLRAVFPEIELGRDASEKLAAMEARGIEVPDVIREHWFRSKGAYQGLIEGKGFTIELHLGEDELRVAAIYLDVRGSGDPMPALHRLMRIEGWKVTDLRGNPPTLDSWRSFGTWRDSAIRQIDGEAT